MYPLTTNNPLAHVAIDEGIRLGRKARAEAISNFLGRRVRHAGKTTTIGIA